MTQRKIPLRAPTVVVLLCSLLLTSSSDHGLSGGSTEWTRGVVPTTASQPPAPQWEGDPISLKLVDVSLVDFFRTMSELTGLNILIDPDVRGAITINVEEVPWDLLFESVLRSRGLTKTIEANLVRISTRQTVRSEEEHHLAQRRAAFMAAETVTITRHLNYSVARELIAPLEKQLSERGQIDVDERTNTLIITDIPGAVDRLQNLVSKLDIAEQQIEIEARIVEATTRFARDLGVELGITVGRVTDRNIGTAAVSALPAQPVGAVAFSTGRMLDVFQLDALLAAAESTGEARILSKPRVSAQNNAQATITQGAKIPIPVQQNFTTTVRFETAALQLTVTPQVTEDNTVLLQIRVENNVPDFSQTVLGIPTILTSESETIVLVQNGGTTVIGGIFVETDREAQDKVPGLGDIPVFGNLFKRSQRSRETREILFFITPRIKGDPGTMS